MKKTLLATAVFLAAAVPTVASAQLAFNVGATTDYRYRGISQTRLKPALQGGVDYSHASGFYVGAWASTIKWIKDSAGDSSVEVDLYGGYKGEISKTLSYDVGVLNYWYPRAVTTAWSTVYANPNTSELYGALTYGPATLKYSHAVTNLFGNMNSKNSYYLDLSATFDVAGFSVVPHLGYQKVKSAPSLSYTDYSITVSKDFNGLVPSIAIVGTDTKDVAANPNGYAYYSPAGKNLGRAALVVGVKYNF
ncbi:MAG TPA: TorF family putative porin [Aquabacterium sp.]|nr:TorF family putative porin [Aquabacterium sp.]